MPADALELHRNISQRTVGPGSIYLWKPFLYRLFTELDKLIVLDFDVLLLGDLLQLWRLFDTFLPASVLGLAREQQPTYGPVWQLLSGLGPFSPSMRSAANATTNTSGQHHGFNGGVQLHYLSRMRGSLEYEEQLRLCGSGACLRHAASRRLGDQTLYSELCVRDPSLCHMLPCGWNRQLSTRFWHREDFKARHRCTKSSGDASLIHGNQPLLELAVFWLQEETGNAFGRGRPTCRGCVQAITTLKSHAVNRSTRNPRHKWGSDKLWMSEVLLSSCCPKRQNVLAAIA